MPLLSNIDRIAADRGTYVYAFRRLAKLHNIPTGRAQDFFHLTDTIRSNPEFRSDLFRIAASALSNSPELSINDTVTIVALAIGGDELAAQHEPAAPDDLVELFTNALSPTAEDDVTEAQQPTPAPAPATTPAPAPAQPVSLPSSPARAHADAPQAHTVRPARQVLPIQPESVASSPRPLPSTGPQPAARRPPILQQALLAAWPVEDTLPEPTAAEHPAEVLNEIERLKSERRALERRVEEMERRLEQVVQEVESLETPARRQASPPVPVARTEQPGRAPERTAEPTVRSPLNLVSRDDVNPPPTSFARSQPPNTAPPDQINGIEDESSLRITEVAGRMAVFTGLLRSRARLIAVAAIVLAALLLLSHFIVRRPQQTAPTQPQSSTAAPATPRAQAEADITNLLAAWASASANNDPATESTYYAPTVDRYFLERNVSREFIRNDKQAYRDRGNRMQRFTVSDLNFQFQSPSSAVVSFTKTWSVLGPMQTGFLHSSRSRVWLSRLPEGWRITGEQDLRREQ